MTRKPDETITSFDIPDEPMDLRESFRDTIDSAIELQEEFPEGSAIYKQYQIFIDVGKSLLEMVVD